MKPVRSPLFCALMILVSVSCGGGDGSSTGPGNQVATTINVSPAVDSLDAGTTRQLTAVVLDQSGHAIAGESVSWTATDRSVVDVSSTGLVTGLVPGNTIVQAAIGGLTGSSAVNVRVPPAARFTIDTIGRILGPSDVGQVPADTTGTADASAIELPNKQIRVYYGLFAGAGPGHIGSAISTDGTHFTVEAGLRDAAGATPSEGFGSPLIFALPGGGYRLFYNGCHALHCGTSSATSSDGLNFTADANATNGLGEYSALDQPDCSAIVKLSNGNYRIYCGQLVIASTPQFRSGYTALFSATSSDLLTWTTDPGIRIGPGAPTLVGDVRHPTAIVNADGSVSLIYYQNRTNIPTPREMISTSTDGLTFTTEYDLGVAGTEPSIVKRSDGSFLIYYGEQTAAAGSTISVGKVTPIVH